jgi:hypothetical protein
MVKIVIYSKTLYAIIGVFISLLLIGVGVYAYGGTAPATMGHSMGELMPSCTGIVSGTANTANSWSCISSSIPTCTGPEQGLTWTGSLWQCKTLS